MGTLGRIENSVLPIGIYYLNFDFLVNREFEIMYNTYDPDGMLCDWFSAERKLGVYDGRFAKHEEIERLAYDLSKIRVRAKVMEKMLQQYCPVGKPN